LLQQRWSLNSSRTGERSSTKGRLANLVALLALAIPAALGSYASADDKAAREDKPATVDSRQIWVLADQGGTPSEAGLSASGVTDIVPYEISCAAGELRSVHRKLNVAAIYGAAAWTVRISGSPASESGAEMLKSALENICKTE
jgi:hypothetical protein